MKKAALKSLLFICDYFNCGKLRVRQCFFGVLFFVVVLMFNIKFNKPVFHYFKNKDYKSACALPKFDMFDSSIDGFFWEMNAMTCQSSESLMYIDDKGFLKINETIKEKGKYSSLECVCKPVLFVSYKGMKYGENIQCTQPVYISHDFIYAECTNEGSKVYDELLYHVDYKSIFSKKTFKNETRENLSVYFYGYDAMSNLVARRKMPLTINYLENVLEAYTFNGYTKVGDNTWPNLIALLGGDDPVQSSKIMNEAPLLWKNFSEKGYVTMFSEDYPALATFRGFKNQPTEHFMVPFFEATDVIQPVNRDLRKVSLLMEYKNLKSTDSSYLCYGKTPKHKIMIEYYKKYIEAYKNLRKFGWSFNTELGHDYLNFYQFADKDSVEFFKWMYDTGNLENAVLVLYSDHGPRYSEIQNTNIGRVTSLMPIFSMYIPKHIKEKYPHVHENLLKNAERLTTAYDVHETILDIINSRFEYSEETKVKKSKGISLFRPIPEKRSCFDAHVPEHYCPCYSSEEIDVKAKHVKIMAKVLVQKLNKLLEKYSSKCARLTLKSIVRASMVKSNFERDKSMEERFSIRSYLYSDTQDTKYLISIETTPGDAKFEATVHYKSDSDVEISGDINRINRYGDQSKCIDDKILKLYCFCN